MELGAPVEEGAVLIDAGSAFLSGASGDYLVLLGGQHRQMQALLDESTTGGVAVQPVGDGCNHLVGAMRGSGKNALGHGTFAPVDGLVLVNSLPSFGLVGSLLLGLVPWQYDWGGSRSFEARLVRALSFLRAGQTLPGRGLGPIAGGR